MARPFVDSPPLHRRRFIRWLGLAILIAFFVAGWSDQSAEETLEFAAAQRLMVVTNAGPVEVLTGQTLQVTHADSWLGSRPEIESAAVGGEAVVRVRCEGIMPCRSALTIEAPPGAEVVVVSEDDLVNLTQFDGSVTVYSRRGGVSLGAVSGSAKIVSLDGDVIGTGMELDTVTVAAEHSAIAMSFAAAPQSVVITGGSASVELYVPDVGYSVSVRQPDGADSSHVQIGIEEKSPPSAADGRLISVVSAGPVTVMPATDPMWLLNSASYQQARAAEAEAERAARLAEQNADADTTDSDSGDSDSGTESGIGSGTDSNAGSGTDADDGPERRNGDESESPRSGNGDGDTAGSAGSTTDSTSNTAGGQPPNETTTTVAAPGPSSPESSSDPSRTDTSTGPLSSGPPTQDGTPDAHSPGGGDGQTPPPTAPTAGPLGDEIGDNSGS